MIARAIICSNSKCKGYKGKHPSHLRIIGKDTEECTKIAVYNGFVEENNTIFCSICRPEQAEYMLEKMQKLLRVENE